MTDSKQTDKRQDDVLKKVWSFLWGDSVFSWIIQILLAFLVIKFIIYPGLGFVFNTSYPIVAVVSGSMEHMIVPGDNTCADYFASGMPQKNFERYWLRCGGISQYGGLTKERARSFAISDPEHLRINAQKPNICGHEFDKSRFSLNFEDYWKTCGAWYEAKNITKQDFSSYLFSSGFNKGDIFLIYHVEPKNLKIGDTIVFLTPVYIGQTNSYPIIHRIVSIQEKDGKSIFITKGDHNEASGSIDYIEDTSMILGKGVFRVPYLGYAKIWLVNLAGYAREILA
jgi:signal peptidase I